MVSAETRTQKATMKKREIWQGMAGEVCLLLYVLPEQGKEPNSNEFSNFSAGINWLNQLSNPPLGLIAAVVSSTSVSYVGLSH